MTFDKLEALRNIMLDIGYGLSMDIWKLFTKYPYQIIHNIINGFWVWIINPNDKILRLDIGIDGYGALWQSLMEGHSASSLSSAVLA